MALVPNIAAILKSEIARVARKEARAETLSLKKAVTTYRSEIAALKRRAQLLEQQLKRLIRVGRRLTPTVETEDTPAPRRFSAKGLKSQRRRLGLSAAECGLLVGASAQSIYNWEEGKVRPRAQHLSAIAALKALTKKEAKSRLDSLKAAAR
jgi:DNA-binding transcriptional regulator YiaG